MEQRKSLAELAGGMGKKLEAIEGQTVMVTGLTFDSREVRALRDDPERGWSKGDLVTRDVAFIATGDGEQYYTFSEPLIDKLKAIDTAALPAEGVFRRVDLTGDRQGQRVWTIE
jgi:hypothetical protein